MQSLFFKSDWLLRRLKRPGVGTGGALLTLADLAHESDCYLVMESYQNWKLREDGCHIIPFKWKVPSQEALQLCLSKVKKYFKFSNFQSITQEEFETGGTDEFSIDVLSSLEFALYIEELAEHNENILAHPDQ